MQPRNAGTHRSLLTRSAAIFGIRIAPALAAAVVAIAFSHLVPRAINGVYQELWVTLAVMIAIGSAGIPPLMLTHSHNSVDRWILALRRRHAVYGVFWLCGMTAIFVMLLRSQWAQFRPWMLSAFFAVQMMVLLTETYLIIHRRFALVAALSVLYALLFGLVHFLFIKGILNLSLLLGAITIITAIRGLGLISGAVPTFTTQKKRMSGELLSKEIKGQWLHLGIYDISQLLFRWLDKFIVGRIVGKELFSIYFTGTTDVPFMHTLLGAAGNGLLQQMAGGEKTAASRIQLMRFSGATLSRIVFPAFLFLFIFRAEFVEVVFSKAYLASIPLFAISSCAIPLRAYNFTATLQHLNRVKIINLGAAMDLAIALLLSYPLFLWKGLSGIAFAFTLCSYLQAIFYLFQTAKSLRCTVPELIPWKAWLVQGIVFSVIIIALHYVLSRYCGLRQTLLLGFAGCALLVVAGLLPVILSKRQDG